MHCQDGTVLCRQASRISAGQICFLDWTLPHHPTIGEDFLSFLVCVDFIVGTCENIFHTFQYLQGTMGREWKLKFRKLLGVAVPPSPLYFVLWLYAMLDLGRKWEVDTLPSSSFSVCARDLEKMERQALISSLGQCISSLVLLFNVWTTRKKNGCLCARLKQEEIYDPGILANETCWSIKPSILFPTLIWQLLF